MFKYLNLLKDINRSSSPIVSQYSIDIESAVIKSVRYLTHKKWVVIKTSGANTVAARERISVPYGFPYF